MEEALVGTKRKKTSWSAMKKKRKKKRKEGLLAVEVSTVGVGRHLPRVLGVEWRSVHTPQQMLKEAEEERKIGDNRETEKRKRKKKEEEISMEKIERNGYYQREDWCNIAT